MTDDNKRNDDQDRKKLSDEEMEDVAGGTVSWNINGWHIENAVAGGGGEQRQSGFRVIKETE